MTNQYTYLVTDLLSGNVISSVELNSAYWDEIYKAPGAGLVTARFDLPTTTLANFKDWSNALWFIKDGVIKWGGIIGKTQRRGGTRVLSVPVVGFFEYFRHRFLRSAQGMSYGTLVNGRDITWRDIDPFLIFKDCINHAQSFSDGNIHIGVTWSKLSGQEATSVIKTVTVKSIGAYLEQLSNRLDTGFDWEQVYRWDGNNPRCDFLLTFPQMSKLSPHLLLFQPDITVSTVTNVINAGGFTGAGFASAGDVTNITGNMQIVGAARMTDWTPASDMVIRQKWGSAGNRSFRFSLLTTGKLRFEWTEDGTNVLSEDSDSAVSFANNTVGWVRVTMEVDNGAGDYAVSFEESSDFGSSWTALNTPAANAFGDTFGDSF